MEPCFQKLNIDEQAIQQILQESVEDINPLTQALAEGHWYTPDRGMDTEKQRAIEDSFLLRVSPLLAIAVQELMVRIA